MSLRFASAAAFGRTEALLRQSESEGIPTGEDDDEDGTVLVLAGVPQRNTLHPAAELFWEYTDAHTQWSKKSEGTSFFDRN